MALALIDRCREKRLRNLERKVSRDGIRAKAQDVRTVVLTRHLRRLDICANGRTDVLEPVRRHRHADAATANENTEISRARRHRLRDGDRVVGIVAARRVSRTKIRHLVRARERLHEFCLQFNSTVIGPNRYLHLLPPAGMCKMLVYYTKNPLEPWKVQLTGHANLAPFRERPVRSVVNDKLNPVKTL